ncbi:MAG: phenylalanine 4-monooxygenase [Myxococcales bacterium]|nr:phenylalanine 4-monooxygenase [Myxococcales bacterium]
MKPTALVTLDRDHPGFRDPDYRARRDEIAALALSWQPGHPVPEVRYTDVENEVWSTALRELRPLHQRYACDAFARGWARLAFDEHRVPSFRRVNEHLAQTSGFTLVPVAGLASPAEFMLELAEGRFLATQYVRHASRPLYTPEPDVLHEIIGHAALLADPAFAELNRLFGKATRRAGGADIEALIRVYWYTLEFGVVGRGDDYEVIGAGLLSSFGELGRFRESVPKRAFDLDEIARTPFDPTDYQRVLFVASDVEAMKASLSAWLEAMARR